MGEKRRGRDEALVEIAWGCCEGGGGSGGCKGCGLKVG